MNLLAEYPNTGSLTSTKVKFDLSDRGTIAARTAKGAGIERPGAVPEKKSPQSASDVMIHAVDGLELAATIFHGMKKSGPVAIFASGVALPRRIYRHMAARMIELGARAVITFDYRGVDRPLSPKLARNANMTDWAELDFAGVLAYAEKTFPGSELIGVGHSFGVHVLGISGEHRKISRFLGFACGSGYLKYTDEPVKLNLWLNGIGAWVSTILGRFPAGLGLGGGLPGGVFKQWRSWLNHPDYFMGDERLDLRSRFEAVNTSLRFINFSDDKWATERSLDEIRKWYGDAVTRTDIYSAEKLGREIGHLGIFKKENSDLWDEHLSWLIVGKPYLAQSSE